MSATKNQFHDALTRKTDIPGHPFEDIIPEHLSLDRVRLQTPYGLLYVPKAYIERTITMLLNEWPDIESRHQAIKIIERYTYRLVEKGMEEWPMTFGWNKDALSHAERDVRGF